MARRQTVTWWKALGFTNQSDIKKKIRSIVNTVPLYTPLNEDNTLFLINVLRHHHQFEQKMAGEVNLKHLEIRINQDDGHGPTRGIWIVKKDNTSVGISWHTALEPGGGSSKKQDVCQAARYEINDQIFAFREQPYGLCELCNESIAAGIDIVHVDHIKPFDELFKLFMKTVSITYDNIDTQDRRFIDRNLALQWAHFHKEHATLRVVHKTCNLKRSKKDESSSSSLSQ